MKGEAPRTGSDGVQFTEFGFTALTMHEPWSGTRTAPGLTMAIAEQGAAALDLGTGPQEFRPLEIVLFWSGLPNRMTAFAPGTVIHGAHAPIVEVLSWSASHAVLTRAFGGQFLRLALMPEVARAECASFGRWSSELRGRDGTLRYACRLEVEARFRRLLAELACSDAPADPPPMSSTAAGVAAAMTFAAEHFVEPITINDIAAAVGWNRDHLMESFRRMCGITLWEYVLRIRVAEARRLLESTDIPIGDVCGRSGFGSLSRMYEAFRQFRGTTPADYRRGA